MARYQLRLGNETLPALLDRIAADATAVAPGLGRKRARDLLERLLRERVLQTATCGTTEECRMANSLWGSKDFPAGEVRQCCLEDADPFSLPNAFAREATALIDPLWSDEERDSLEDRLATIFRSAISPLLFRGDFCGTLAQCRSTRTDPWGSSS